MTSLPEVRTPAPLAHSADGCRTCRVLPAGPPTAGTLFLSPPADEPHANLLARLAEAGCRVTEPQAGMMAVPLADGLLERLAVQVGGLLSETEARCTRALVVPPDRQPTLADFMNTQPLGTLLAAVRSRWLVEVLRQDRLETHFQPIVPADDPAEAFAYECLVRGQDGAGGLIAPRELFTAARTADLLFHLDRAARLCAIRCAARQGVAARLFVNFMPSSIYTPSFCLKSTFKAVEQAGLDPARVVFEVVESEEIADTAHLLRILEVYREAGFGVALDDVGAGYSSLNLLTRLRPDYVKLDMQLTRGVDRDPYKAQVVGKLLEMAKDLGVKTVVEGVETVGEWAWAAAHGADYMQGYLFARPAAVPPLPVAPDGVAV
jgi:EAL domain-containing protein (putative c-di-GMP-specific phosphodiesterase class I)